MHRYGIYIPAMALRVRVRVHGPCREPGVGLEVVRLTRRNFVYWGCGYIGGRVWTWFGYLQRFDSNGEGGSGQ